jgi:hypothetical protein
MAKSHADKSSARPKAKQKLGRTTKFPVETSSLRYRDNCGPQTASTESAFDDWHDRAIRLIGNLALIGGLLIAAIVIIAITGHGILWAYRILRGVMGN